MGQFQNVPGPSQDEFDAQTQAIANIETITRGTPTPATGYTFGPTQISLVKINKIVYFHAALSSTAAVVANRNYNAVATIPNEFKPKSGLVPPASGVIMDGSGLNNSACRVWVDGNTLNFGTGATVPSGTPIIYFNMTYVTE